MKTMSTNARDMKGKAPTWIEALKKCYEMSGSAPKSNNQCCISWEWKKRIVGSPLLTINCSCKPR